MSAAADPRGLRIGDAERDEAARALGEHFAAGRLERGEYDERCDAALAARTWSDLTPLFADLPPPVAAPPAPAPPTGGPAPWGRRRRRWGGVPVVPLAVLGVIALAVEAPLVLVIGLLVFLHLRSRGRHHGRPRGGPGGWSPGWHGGPQHGWYGGPCGARGSGPDERKAA